MKTNESGLKLIKDFEGCKLHAYICPAGKWTIGYGHTKGVNKRTGKITQEQAEQLLKEDVEDFEIELDLVLRENGIELNENQYSAIISFCFNLGINNFINSTLFKVIKKDPENYKEIDKQFMRWVYGGGKILPGLMKRRAAESLLYQTPPKINIDDYFKCVFK